MTDVIHRDGKCLNCGGVIGLKEHHIKSRGSGGEDAEENKITLCIWCHDQAHTSGCIVVGHRMVPSKARRKGCLVYSGDRMRIYFRELVKKQIERRKPI